MPLNFVLLRGLMSGFAGAPPCTRPRVLPRTLRNPAPRGSAPWIPNCDSWCRCRALRLTLSGEVAGAVPHASRLAIWGPMYGGGEVRCRTNPFAVSSSNRESPCRRRFVSSGTYRNLPIVRCQFKAVGVALMQQFSTTTGDGNARCLMPLSNSAFLG